MLKEERFAHILDSLKKRESVYINELVDELQVSDDTIRRDLGEMDEKGLITKVRGGAIPRSGIPLDYGDRALLTSVAKTQMAQKAVPFLKSGQTVFIDGGTSNMAIAQQVPRDMELTIFTNSFPIVEVLREHPKIDLHFIGGRVAGKARVTQGLETLSKIASIRTDWLILGVSNIHLEFGVTVPIYEESLVKKEMVVRAKSTLAIVDTEKLNTAASFKVCDVDDLDVLVFENDLPMEKIERYRSSNVNIVQ